MPQTISVVRAYDRSLIREIPTDDAQALERKLAAAAKVFQQRDSWLKTHQRSAILQRAAVLVGERRQHFAELMVQEGGKPMTDTLAEVDRAIDGLVNAASELRNFAGREIPMGFTPASDGRMAFTIKEPIGIVAAISAFNHPLNLVVHQIAPAVAVGCPVIIKPASTTPLSCLEFVALMHEAGLPEPWCQSFIAADNALAEQFAIDPRVAFLSFIGSARVGWHLHSKLAHGTRSALEHGGVAPVIVDRSADLDQIIEPITKGGYYHAGQVCVSVQRIFVHSSILADFVEKFSKRVLALRTGDPLLPQTEVGPLIHPREADRVASWIEEAVAGGAQLIGGGRLSESTLKPAILVNPPDDAKISTMEVFGPVTCVYAFDDVNRAIDLANSLPVAFQASVFAKDIDQIMHVARRIDASAVMVNDHTAFRTDWMPFAGRRESGYGIGGIPWTMREMSQEKMIVFKFKA
jgi:acyl-CoA reductase-like NAD-dependent aldehyde dehydrogenase